MRYLKIVFYFIFSFAVLYTCYTPALLVGDKLVEYFMYMSADTLPDTIYLNTQNGKSVFSRKKGNKYCSQQNCGYISQLTSNGFVFKWEKAISLKFLQSKTNPSVYIQSDLNEKTPPYTPISISFNLENNHQIEKVSCIKNNCTINGEKKPYSFVISAKHVSSNNPFEKNFHPTESDVIILNDKGNIRTFKKDSDAVFKEITIPQKQNRFLIIISSYKRPIYLTGLIHRLFEQTYTPSNFDIALSLKGLHKSVITNILDPDFKEFISQNRLFVHQDTNKNQFSNMLDAFRNIDLSNYDYIVKVDNDDWYHKDYLKTLNLIINALQNPQVITSGILYSIKKNPKETYLKSGLTSRSGPSILFSTQFAKELLKLENQSPDEIKKLNNPHLPLQIKNAYEDIIINAIAHFNNQKYLYFTLTPLFLYNQTNTSIMQQQN